MGQVVRKDKGRTVGRIARRRRIVSLDTCVETDTCQQTTEVNILARERVAMNLQGWAKRLRASAILAALLVTAGTFAGIKNMAVVVSAGSRLSDVSLADLAKLCKGVQKTWPDGKNFTLVMRDPESPEMRLAAQKLFGAAPGDVKALIGRLNEARLTVKIVENDEDLLRTVEAIPLSNSSMKATEAREAGVPEGLRICAFPDAQGAKFP